MNIVKEKDGWYFKDEVNKFGPFYNERACEEAKADQEKWVRSAFQRDGFKFSLDFLRKWFI